jgi:hypothetical protein
MRLQPINAGTIYYMTSTTPSCHEMKRKQLTEGQDAMGHLETIRRAHCSSLAISFRQNTINNSQFDESKER